MPYNVGENPAYVLMGNADYLMGRAQVPRHLELILAFVKMGVVKGDGERVESARTTMPDDRRDG